jgi:CBS domain-containing protein
MAERYAVQDERRYDDRGRHDSQWNRDAYHAERDRHERGLLERAGDEVRSWFGDETAEQRRLRDERADRHSYNAASHEQYGHEQYGRGQYGDARALDVMTQNVRMVHAWDSVEFAARLMYDFDCGSLPVTDESGRLVGIVTDRDITVRVVGRGKDSRRTRVSECMSGDLVACYEDEPIENCMRQMSRHQIRRLPIVDDRQRVIGIVSQGDLARHSGSHPGWGERRAFADTMCAVSQPSSKSRHSGVFG